MKRLTVPNTWPILKRAGVFITRPNPGSHNLTLSLPLAVLVKEVLNLGITTTREVKKVIDGGAVVVNGKKITDLRHPVGLLDTISILDKHYRLILSAKGKLAPITIKENEVKTRIARVARKTATKNGIQITLSDGTNLTDSKNEYKVGDSVVLESEKAKKHLPLKEGAAVYLIKGKHIGEQGHLSAINGNEVRYKDAKNNEVLTLRSYVMVVGAKTPEVALHE